MQENESNQTPNERKPKSRSSEDLAWAELIPAIRGVVQSAWNRFRPTGLTVDELAQETAVAIWQAANRESASPRDVLAYAHGVALRLIFDHFRLRHTVARRRRILQDEHLPSPPVQDELQRAVEDAVSTLSREEQDLLRLRFQGGLSLSQISEIRQTAISTTYNSLQSALGRLRQAVLAISQKNPLIDEMLNRQWPRIEE